MADRFVSRGFQGRRQPTPDGRVPPGQYLTRGFPVLSAGPTPRTPLDRWSFTVDGLVRQSARWSWEDPLPLPARDYVADIHCVTKWSKLDTRWSGADLDTLLERVEIDPRARAVLAYCDGGNTTNLPLENVRGGRAFVAYRYGGQPLDPEHGGPARLVVLTFSSGRARSGSAASGC